MGNDPYMSARIEKDKFKGEVKDIEMGKVSKERLYLVKYDDDDLEHLTLDQVKKCAVEKVNEAKGKGKAKAKAAKSVDGAPNSEQQHRETKKEAVAKKKPEPKAKAKAAPKAKGKAQPVKKDIAKAGKAKAKAKAAPKPAPKAKAAAQKKPAGK